MFNLYRKLFLALEKTLLTVENFCDKRLLWPIDQPKILEYLQDIFQQMWNFSGRGY